MSEPDPKPGGAPVLPVVREHFAARVRDGYFDPLAWVCMDAVLRRQYEKGLQKYGIPCSFNDGRSIGDAYEELADLIMYAARHTGSGETEAERLKNVSEVEELCDTLAQTTTALLALCRRARRAE